MGDLYQNLKATGIKQDQAVQNMMTTIGTANEEKRRAKEALNKAKNAIPQDPGAVAQAQADYSAAKAKAAEAGVQATVGDWGKMSTDGYGSGTNAQDAPGSGSQPGQLQSGNGNQSQSGNGNQSQSGGSDHSQRFSKSFYDAVGRAVKGAPQGNTLDAASATAKEQAQNQRNESANRQMEAQKSQQIADRNEFAEAGKIASVQNDAQNRQNIANKEGLSGAAAAMQRTTNTPDVAAQQARQDQQRNVANQRREEADAAQQGSTESEGQSMQFKIQSRDYNEDKDTEDRLSKGNGTGEEVTETSNETKEEPKEEEEEQQPVADEEPEAEEETSDMPNDQPDEPQEPQEETPEDSGTTWQNVMNYLTYGNDPTSGWNKGTKPGFAEAKKYADSKGWAPINASQAEFDGDLGHLQDLVKQQQPGFYEEWQGGSGRVGEGGKQINRGDAGDEVIDKTEINSDERIKNLRSCLSDMRMKCIKEDWDRDGRPSQEDFEWLCRQAGPFTLNDKEYNYDSDDYDESVLGAYADNIRNYVYNYKPGAEQIDPSNDPSVEHIGPMAQDIEQVNPAVVHENAQGIKSVDTARLAMMNAGAIGDLARALKDIDERLKRLGV